MELQAGSTIATLVDALLPHKGSTPLADGSAKALYVQVDISLNVYGDDSDDFENSFVHLIFERPTNYTTVWSCVSLGPNTPTPNQFTMRSNHDSCWRTDGLRDIHKAHSNAFKELRKRFPNSKIHESNRIELVQWVGVTYTTDPSDSTRKTLRGITPLTQLDGRHKSLPR